MTNWPWIALTLLCVIGILIFAKTICEKFKICSCSSKGKKWKGACRKQRNRFQAGMEQEAVRLEVSLARCEEQTQRMCPIAKSTRKVRFANNKTKQNGNGRRAAS